MAQEQQQPTLARGIPYHLPGVCLVHKRQADDLLLLL